MRLFFKKVVRFSFQKLIILSYACCIDFDLCDHCSLRVFFSFGLHVCILNFVYIIIIEIFLIILIRLESVCHFYFCNLLLNIFIFIYYIKSYILYLPIKCNYTNLYTQYCTLNYILHYFSYVLCLTKWNILYRKWYWNDFIVLSTLVVLKIAVLFSYRLKKWDSYIFLQWYWILVNIR